MDTKEILKWTAKILTCIVMAIFLNILSDKYGRGVVTLNALAIALLFFCIGKSLLKRK
jgi:MFS family permease